MKSILFLFIFCTLLSAKESILHYEGSLSYDQHIWLEVDTSSQHISASYFNKFKGEIIKLIGKKENDTLFLEEYNSNKLAASWSCNLTDELLKGKRFDHTSGYANNVTLLRTESKYKEYSYLHYFSFPHSSYINDSIGALREPPSTSHSKEFDISLTRSYKGIFQYRVTKTLYSCHIMSDTKYFLYDVVSNKRIHVLSELDPSKIDSLYSLLHKRVQPEYESYRKKQESTCYCDLDYSPYRLPDCEPNCLPHEYGPPKHTCIKNKDSLWIYRLLGSHEVYRILDIKEGDTTSSTLNKRSFDFAKSLFEDTLDREKINARKLSKIVDSIFTFHIDRFHEEVHFQFEGSDEVLLSQEDGYLKPPIDHDIELPTFGWYERIPIPEFVYFLKPDSPLRRFLSNYYRGY